MATEFNPDLDGQITALESKLCAAKGQSHLGQTFDLLAVLAAISVKQPYLAGELLQSLARNTSLAKDVAQINKKNDSGDIDLVRYIESLILVGL